jgi:hypothetical protein
MPPSSPTLAVPGRARTLLIVLAIVAAGGLAYEMWPAAMPKSPPSNERDARQPQQGKAGGGSLDVRLDELKQPPPAVGDAKRNPFRFYVPPPPPPPPRPTPAPAPPQLHPGDQGYVPPPPPPPPPITIKFIGVEEHGGKKMAIFSDGKGLPVWASEGQIVFGQYKLLKIGVESVTMSYLDGKGTQTIPMRGGGSQ